MLCFQQEDDHKAEENDGGDENGTSASVGEGSGNDLPVVKGVCVDYVHANRDGASLFGRQKWRESGR